MLQAACGNESVKRGLALLEALQRIEGALLEERYAHITVPTRHGSFEWIAVERAPAA